MKTKFALTIQAFHEEQKTKNSKHNLKRLKPNLYVMGLNMYDARVSLPHSSDECLFSQIFASNTLANVKRFHHEVLIN